MFFAKDDFYCVNCPVAFMRKYPDKNSEIVSQAIFSESVRPLEYSSGWVKIETLIDNYPGWIKEEELLFQKNKFLDGSEWDGAQVCRHAAHVYHVQDTIYGPLFTLPFESRLRVIDSFDGANDRWLKILLHDDSEAYIQRGDVILEPRLLTNCEEMCCFSQRFLGLPYTWGGRSSFGYDCSGFVQMLYRQQGIYLPRDSKDQCHWSGFIEVPIDSLRAGDLIFFGTDKGKIGHVGMYLESGNFIHATVLENEPYIHISSMNGKEWRGESGSKYSFRTARRMRE